MCALQVYDRTPPADRFRFVGLIAKHQRRHSDRLDFIKARPHTVSVVVCTCSSVVMKCGPWALCTCSSDTVRPSNAGCRLMGDVGCCEMWAAAAVACAIRLSLQGWWLEVTHA